MLVIKQMLVSIDFHSIFFLTMEVNGDQQLFGSSEFFQISYFVFNIGKKLIQTWGWVNDDKTFIFGWMVDVQYIIRVCTLNAVF